MKAFGEYLVGAVLDDGQEVSPGGILINSKRKLIKIKVTSAGKKATEELGEDVTGQVVLIGDYDHPVYSNSLIVNYKDIYAGV